MKLLLALLLFPVAASAQSVTLTWNPVTTNTNGVPLPAAPLYNVYRCQESVAGTNCPNPVIPAVAPWALLSPTTGLGTPTYTDTTVVAGQTYQYFTTAVCGGACARPNPASESAPSSVATAVIPIATAPPSPPTNLNLTISALTAKLTVTGTKASIAYSWGDPLETTWTLWGSGGKILTQNHCTGTCKGTWNGTLANAMGARLDVTDPNGVADVLAQ